MAFKTKEEWSAAVDAYKKKHGTSRGFQKGKLQYIDADGKAWSYAAGTRGGPGHPRSASSTANYSGRRASMEVDQTLGATNNNEANRIFNQAGRNAGVEKGVHQMHHMRTLNQFEPLLAGLEGDDLEEALVWFQNEGFDLGNLEGNLKKQFTNTKAGGTTVSDTHQGKGSIHEWMRKHRLEPNTIQKEYKQIADMFKGKSLNERLPMYVNYLEYVQGAVQEKLEVPTAYDWINNTRKQVGTIPSGPRAGQRLPVNRATLADSIIKDLTGPSKLSLKRQALQGLSNLPKVPKWARVGSVLTTAGVIGDASQAAEGTVGVVTKTGKEQTAAGLNLASGALGLASLAAPPLTAAAIGTGIVGMLADNRIERDKRKDRDTDIKAGRIQLAHQDPYSTTITAPKPSTLDKIKQNPGNEAKYVLGQLRDFILGI